MKKVAIFGFHGVKDCGKTTLMSRVITRLTEKGYRVAAVKHTRGSYTVHRVGTDTHRHWEAGAGLVVLTSPLETSLVLGKELELEVLLELVSHMGNFDMVLLEGYKGEAVRGVDVAGRDDWNLEEVVSEIEDEMETVRVLNRLPLLDCGKCGYPSCIELAAVGDPADCTSANAVKLRVNGQPVELSQFPEDMIRNVLLAMVGSLKGVEKVDHLVIEFSTGDGPWK